MANRIIYWGMNYRKATKPNPQNKMCMQDLAGEMLHFTQRSEEPEAISFVTSSEMN